MAGKSGTIYVNADKDTAAVFKLSNKAGRLLLPIYCNIDTANRINKSSIQKKVLWVKDTRTWKKYWSELTAAGVLVFLDQQIAMVSPHECYREGNNHLSLITEWNKIYDAVLNKSG